MKEAELQKARADEVKVIYTFVHLILLLLLFTQRRYEVQLKEAKQAAEEEAIQQEKARFISIIWIAVFLNSSLNHFYFRTASEALKRAQEKRAAEAARLEAGLSFDLIL